MSDNPATFSEERLLAEGFKKWENPAVEIKKKNLLEKSIESDLEKIEAELVRPLAGKPSK